MNKSYTVNGTYGSGFTPDQVHVVQDDNGINWYAVDGSHNVNATFEAIDNGVHVEYLQDIDCFTHYGDNDQGVDSLEELESAVSEFVEYLEESQA